MTAPRPPFADRCPCCSVAVAYPRVLVDGPGWVECLYQCAGCGHRWFTTWAPDDEGSEAA